MAVSVRSSSIRGEDDTTETVIVPVPSGTTTGDIVTLWCGTWQPFGTPTPPAGFTLIGSAVQLDLTRIMVWWRRAIGPEAGDYTFTGETGNFSNAGAITWQGGLASGDPIEDFATATATGTTYPALQVDSSTGAGLGWFSYNESADGTHDPPTGYTSTPQNYGMAASAVAASAGTQNATGATAGSSMDLVSMLVAIAPEPDSGPVEIQCEIPLSLALGATTEAQHEVTTTLPLTLTTEATAQAEHTITTSLPLSLQLSTESAAEHQIQAEIPLSLLLTAATNTGVVEGFTLGDITGAAKPDQSVTGPTTLRQFSGPLLRRNITGGHMITGDVTGPAAAEDQQPDGPTLSREVDGPATSRTLTGPEA